MPALGSGRTSPTAFIAFCPSGRSSTLSQCESCSRDQFSCLRPLHLWTLWTLLGQAYIQVSGHPLPVLHNLLATFGHTRSAFAGALG